MQYNGGYSNKQQVIAFIRRKYDKGSWPITAGKVDYKFVEYVEKNNLDLLNYFSDGGGGAELIDPVSGAEIDFLHMMASANALLHKSSYLFDDEDFNDLAGWTGELQQAIRDLQKYQKKNNIIADLESISKGFSIKDMLADIDAYNIGVLLNSPSKLSELLRDYYSDDI